MKKNRVDEFIREPKKALFKLAGPVVIGMLVHTLYNVVDTAFVGRVGAEAIAALTFSFPLFFLLFAVHSGIGVGMGSLISRALGAKRKKVAENVAMHGLGLTIIMSLLAVAIGLPLLRPLFILFGASEEVIPLAVTYMSIVLFGMIMNTFVISSMFNAQGDTKTPMIVQVTSLVLNIFLDWWFIYILGWGIPGAAWATVIAMAVSFVMSLIFMHTRSYLHIHVKNFSFSWKMLGEIFKVGFPASLMMLMMSVYLLFINRFMAHFGTEFVAAFGIATRMESVAILPVVALGMASLTLTGMFYGAKRYDLVQMMTWFSMNIGILFISVLGIVFFIFARPLLRVFTPDPVLLAIGVAYFRIDTLTFPLMVISSMTARIMQSMGYGLPGFVINLIRVLIVAVPLAYIFVYVLDFGYLSIAYAMVIGGVVASIVSLIWLRYRFRSFEN